MALAWLRFAPPPLFPVAAQVQTGIDSGSRDRRARRRGSRRHGHALEPGARVRHDDRRHGYRRRQSLPVAAARHLLREGRAAGLPDASFARTCRSSVGQTVPLDLALSGGDGRRDGDRDRQLAGRRHDQRQHQRQPQRAVAAGHARRPRHLVARRIQGAEPPDHASGRRRHVGRPAGHVQRARHDQRAEHAAT